ncbi:Cast domain containing protein, related [Eimeria mitis]|uniref:Cast domain containing protein, related n=1 Tax=Eimeria mitis TaxID=44415 RepID=U6K247_9EIME|nr:Cast domain containing protein, related [Eimeria mitis]CDJ30352.1 Cast domain containing protein, related [Eimeria mitis]
MCLLIVEEPSAVVFSAADLSQSKECPKGYYCPAGTAKAIPCPGGTYNPLLRRTDVSDCMISKAGTYAEEATTSEAGTGSCAKGHFCPPGSSKADQVACPAQTYNPSPGGGSANDCKPCPAGKYCGTGVSEPDDCPEGHYCPVGSSDPRPCPVGTIRKTTGAQSEQDCDPCPAGHYCETPGLSDPTGECEAGTLCLERATNPAPRDGLTALMGTPLTLGIKCPHRSGAPLSGVVCPSLGYCEEGATALQACPNGEFNPYEGGTSSNDCRKCFAGAYCTVVDNKPVVGPCAGGYSCPEGSSTAKAVIAPKGTYAPVGSALPKYCKPGTHAETEGLTECLPCPAGYYCDQAGMGETNLIRKDCRTGMYCEEGSVFHKNCPAGTYNPDKLGQSIDACLPCPAGQYCQTEELSAPTGDCAAGYYCATRSTSIAPLEMDSFGNGPCPTGHYCPEGTPEPVACPGTYQDMPGSTFCNVCPGGYYCPLGAEVSFDAQYICPKGSFCPRGSKHGKEYLCPPGFYNPSQGISSVLSCLPCPPGKYCRTAGLAAESGDCAAGFYCAGGARYPNEVIDECVFESGVLGKGTGTCTSREDPFSSKEEAEEFCKKSDECVGIEEKEELFYVRCGAVEAPDEGVTSIFYPKLCIEAGLCPIGYICPAGTGSTEPSKAANACPPGYYCPEGERGKLISAKTVRLASSAHSLVFQLLQDTALLASTVVKGAQLLSMPQKFVQKGTTAPKEVQKPFLAAAAHISRRKVQRRASCVQKGHSAQLDRKSLSPAQKGSIARLAPNISTSTHVHKGHLVALRVQRL